MATTKKKLRAPEMRDFAGEMKDVSKQGDAMQSAQLASQSAAYDQMLGQQLGAVDAIAGRLDNSYTSRATDLIGESMGNMRLMGDYADRIKGIGGMAEQDIQGTEIERRLNSEALRDLDLGRSLSVEDERMARQAGRVGASARGMAVGPGSAAAEILNRDALATQRESTRRAFAGGVNQMNSGNRLARMSAAGGLYGQGAGIRGNMSQLGLAGSQAYLAADPMARALGSSIPGQTLGASASMVGNTYGQVMQYGSDVFNTNNNAAWSEYIGERNNQQALKLGQMQAGAASAAGQQAGNGAMTGAMIGAGGAIVGGAIIF